MESMIAAQAAREREHLRTEDGTSEASFNVLIGLCGRTEDVWINAARRVGAQDGTSISKALAKMANKTKDPATGQFPNDPASQAERCNIAAH